jgi:C-terminal processing protease CtpA/Prc
MKRIFAAALAAGLAATLAHVPSASAAAAMSQQQEDELGVSYAYLVQNFYKKVEPQNVLDGAHANLIAYLKAQGIANPKVVDIHASGDDLNNVHELQHEVNDAIAAYGAKVAPTKITYAAIAGVLGSVKDKYTTFLDPKAYAELNEGLDGLSFGGVGLTYSVDDTTQNIHVENVIIDGPSDRAGVRDDDEISTIDGKPVKDVIAGATLEVQQSRIQKLLRGDPGTKVTLGIMRAGTAIDPIVVMRETIKQPSVLSKLLPGDIGYALQRRRVPQRRDRRQLEVHRRRPDRDRAGARRAEHRVRCGEHGDHAAAARGAGERLHRIGIRDHRRCDRG